MPELPTRTKPSTLEPLEPRRLLSAGGPLFGGPIETQSPVPSSDAAAVADFDGDGKVDLAFAVGSLLRVAAGDGSGEFTRLIGETIALGGAARSMAAADFSHDGKADLAVSLDSGAAGVMLGRGDGSFTAMSPVAADRDAGRIVTGDFNGDGNLDVAIAGQRIASATATESEIVVSLGLGNGQFGGAVVTRIAGDYPLSIAAGDFNRDGASDLAVGGRRAVQILAAKGDGTFDFPVQFTTDRAADVTVADLNGDGRPDLAWRRTASVGTVEYVLATGNNTFGAVRTRTVGGAIGTLAAGDINGDGAIDLMAGPDSAGEGFFINDGSGAFSAITDAPGASPAVVADFNGDGRTDVLSADFERVYLGLPPPLPPVYLTTRGTLVITGTRRSDVVNLIVSGSRVRTTLNGRTFTSRLSRVKRVEIAAGLGDDRVMVDSSVFSSCLISAGGGNDTVEGGGGNDTIQGDNGNDNLFGGRGSDVIQGGKGNDTVNGGKGVDVVFGNAGADTFGSGDAASERRDLGAGELLE